MAIIRRHWILLALLALAGCSGTRDAYQAADSVEETAKVVSEHYIAIVQELVVLKDSGQLAGEPLARAQRMVQGAKLIIDRLNTAARTYEALRDASTEEQLQRAIDDAVLAVGNLIDLMRGVRAAPLPVSLQVRVLALPFTTLALHH